VTVRVINHGVSGRSGTFSRETARMYKKSRRPEHFPKNWVEKNFFVYNDKKVIGKFRVEISL